MTLLPDRCLPCPSSILKYPPVMSIKLPQKQFKENDRDIEFILLRLLITMKTPITLLNRMCTCSSWPYPTIKHTSSTVEDWQTPQSMPSVNQLISPVPGLMFNLYSSSRKGVATKSLSLWLFVESISILLQVLMIRRTINAFVPLAPGPSFGFCCCRCGLLRARR